MICDVYGYLRLRFSSASSSRLLLAWHSFPFLVVTVSRRQGVPLLWRFRLSGDRRYLVSWPSWPLTYATSGQLYSSGQV